MDTTLRTLTSVIACIALSGCATQRSTFDDPVNRALKLCGNGINAKSAEAYRAAYESAEKKGLSFEAEASQAVDTQIGVLLKQADLKSDANIRAVADEMRATRECVIKQLDLVRPMTRAELLEQCRQDVDRRLSPPGPTRYGIVRYWNQVQDQSSGDVVMMRGYFDTGGTSSMRLLVRCDLRDSRFNEAVIEKSE